MIMDQPKNEDAATPEVRRRKVRVGKVVSEKMNKTVIVAVERTFKHPLYKKYVKRTAKLHAHDEKNDAHEGDTVRVVETRPISKLKRWRVQQVMERAK
jgi:small subunit ribosomal protein S17